MRELHVVALSEDGRHAVLATSSEATRGGFRLALDGRLAAALRGELSRPGETEPRGADLTVKDIQARLRAGESSDQIARSAGLPLARVQRFEGPVLSERARMIDAARDAHVVRGRRGRSTLPLGEAVEAGLGQASGLRPDTVEWTTRRDDEGSWVVTVSWVARARRRSASWTYDPGSRSLVPLDAPSAALGHAPEASARRSEAVPTKTAPSQVAPPRPARPAGRAMPTAKAPATAKAPVRTSRVKPATAARVKPAAVTPARVKPAAARTAAAKPATVTPAKAKPAAARTAAAKPATGTASKGKAPSPTGRPTSRATARPATAATTPRRPGLRVVPDVPAPVRRAPVRAATARAATARSAAARITEPAAVQEAAVRRPASRSRDGVRARASVPGWADVLLSTSPREDAPGGRD